MIDYSYEDFKKDLKKLNIPKPDLIIAIARGGLTIAHHLSELFDIKEVLTINATSYEKTKKIFSPKVSINIPNLDNYHNILIVDDISDSGETFIKVLNKLKEKYPSKNFKTFSIFYKPSSKFQPDFYLHKTEKWVKFFWEKY
jgi:xanthine phosphoribosyltransferase